MAATSSSHQIAGSADGTSQARWTEIQYRRDLCCIAGPFWHHRAGRAVLFTKTTPQRRHTTPRPCYHSEDTGTDRLQQPARNTTTALHLGRLHPIPQQHRPSPPAPGKGGHHYRSGTSGRRSLSPGPATLPSNTDLSTGDSAPWSLTGSYHQHPPSLEAEVDRLMTMLRWAMTILARAKPMVTTREASRSTTLCWKCGRRGHLRSGCPRTQPPDSRKLRRPPRPREPGKEKFRGGFRRSSKRTPRHTPPMCGRSPVGLADQIGNGNHSHCLSRTASASYWKRSWLARSIRTSEGNTPPLRQRSLIFRGPSNHAPNGHRPAWPRPSMLGK